MYKQSLACFLALMMLLAFTEARYLPTRSQDDRLLRLRQLLKDLLENDIDPVEHPMGGFEPRLYKREAVAYDRPMQYLH
ncbi:uncharacterized protein [Halyomorpha halys]|uniref:uncharacterized protein n=1 Tax=Halyomorpha halys TaxID=286706 RepID=UPI0006D51F9F|nr:uncharacterized protein LOC106685192 [Halyomorpha halys]